MIDINLNDIKVNYGFEDVLRGVSFEVKSGEVTALVGPNGSGKSTILKLIMGIEVPTSGKVQLRKNITLGYLSQEETIKKENYKVKDLLYDGLSDIINIEKKLKNYEEKMATTTGLNLEKIIEKYTNLQEQFINAGGYEVDEKIGKIVKGFKIERLLDSEYNVLSGGEKRIVTFASLMIKKPDVLLLDEPTNYLDIETLEWLEDYLKSYKGTILVVSHDRYFLDRVATKIISIEDGHADVYYGNYSYFLEESKRRLISMFNDYKNQQKQIKAMKESINKLREFGRIGSDERFFKRAKSIEKRLEKLEKIDKPKKKTLIPLEFTKEGRSGEDVLTIKDLSICFENKVIFVNANMAVKYGEHVALVGSNGSGKSTLIKEIIKKSDKVKLGANVKIGYISQKIDFLEEERLYDVARKYFKGEESHLRSALFQFLFTNDNIFKRVSSLSGGEKVRLKLFCLMQEDVNFLILDEPTNHIDITTREVLEDTLSEYDGTILFVSHDRVFINKLANKVISIEDSRLVEYIGNYDDYKEALERKR